jgi:Arabinose-binding domain of AraC transcription regulator, N-term
LTTDAFPPPVLDDAVADLALRFATELGVSVPKRAGDGDRLADVWAALSSAGVTHPGLAFAGWATRTWLGGVFPTILANTPDLGALLDRLQRFHPLFGKQRLMLANDRRSTSVWLEAPDGTSAHPDTIDAFFAILCWLTRTLTSNRAAPSRVVLRRPPPPDPDMYRELLGDVRFGAAHDRCTFDAKSLGAPIERADPAILTALEPYAQRRVAEQGRTFTGPRR